MRTIGAEKFVNSFSQPRELFLSSLENIAGPSTKKASPSYTIYVMKRSFLRATDLPELQLTGARGVSSTVEKDPKKCKHAFDEFIPNTRYISPVIKELFDQMDRVYRKYSDNYLTPLDD